MDGIISYQSTFQEVRQCAARHALEYHSEGETRRLADDQIVFQKRWIAWNQYQLYFHGKSRKTKVTGFHFVQPE